MGASFGVGGRPKTIATNALKIGLSGTFGGLIEAWFRRIGKKIPLPQARKMWHKSYAAAFSPSQTALLWEAVAAKTPQPMGHG
jgi:hypothetical protein